HMMPERVPQHDLAEVFAHARRAGVRLVGPNSNGLISPRRSRLGGLGGEDPERMFVPGPVGVVSRSGGMCGEIGWQLKRHGLGVSTAVSMGGDLMVGTPFVGFLELFGEDPETEVALLFGEPGTTYEEDAAAFIREGRFAKPAVAFIAGRFIDRYPQGVPFGHAAAMVSRGMGSPAAKVQALREAGVRVAETFEELPLLVHQALEEARAGRRT
ncbi:MAG: succinate--CoA ligase subunit alpha, partial [Nitrospinota bacterium]